MRTQPKSEKRNLVELLENRTLLSVALTTLATFDGSTTGAQPQAGLAADSSGNLWGVTSTAGPSTQGTLFEVTTAGGLNIVASFDGGADGGALRGTPAFDSAGNLFDTTSSSGGGHGTIFRLLNGATSIQSLATFIDISGSDPVLDGGAPLAGVYIDSSGNLFGTSAAGGNAAAGTVYELPAGSDTINPLASLGGADGSSPESLLVPDAEGDLIGTTSTGGLNGGGTLFKYVGSSNLDIIASFPADDTTGPRSGVVLDSAGNIFGTVSAGGANDEGYVYEVPAGTGTINTLADFNVTNGSDPIGGLVFDSAGDLFGTTNTGGTNGDGTIFEIPVTTHTLKTLFNFSGANGAGPQDAPILDSAGNLYGTTDAGGTANEGTAWKLTGIGDKLAITQAPTTGSVATSLLPAVTVTEENSTGAIITTGTTSVTLALASDSGTLSGTLTEPLVNGVATFSDLKLDTADAYTLTATDSTDTPATTGTITVTNLSGLTPTILHSTLPTSYVTGTAAHGQVQVKIINLGQTAVTGNGTVAVYASTDGTVDDTSILLASLPHSLSAAAGHALTIPVNVKTFPSTLLGSYTLVAKVTDPSDNSAVSPAGPSLNAAAGFISFAETFVQNTLPAAVVGGAKTPAVFEFKVTNDGNLLSKGSSTITPIFSTDGQAADGTALPPVTMPIVLKPGASKTITLHLKTLPVLSDGSYFLLAQVADPDANITQVASPTTTAFAGPFISLVPSNGATTVAKDLSATVTFTLSNTGNINSVGSSTITFIATNDPNSQAGTTVYNKSMNIPLVPGKSKVLKVKLTAAQWAIVTGTSNLLIEVVDPATNITTLVLPS